jgi:hypothetical protein
MDNHNIKSKSNYRQALEEKHINAQMRTNKVIIITIII